MSSKIEILKKATCISQYIKIDTIKFLMKHRSIYKPM